MSSDDRRARARRRAWGRGPAVLRFEPLEGRQLLSASDPIAEIAAVAAASVSTTATVTATDDPAALAAQSGTAVVTTSAQVSTTTNTNSSTYDGSNLVASAFDTLHNLDWGDPFHAVGTVRNLGSTPTPVAYNVKVYASTKPTLTPDAVLVGTVAIPAGVPAGAKTDFDAVLTAPRVPLATLGNSPSYYLIPKLAPESGALKTTALATSPLTSVVTVTPKIPPKLVGAGLSVSPGSVAWGGTLTVTASVKNDSQGVAPPTNARIVLTPVGKAPGGSSDYQIGQVPIPGIGAYQTVTASQTILLPTFAPTVLSSTSQYTVTMIQDADATASPLLTPTLAAASGTHATLTIATPPGTPAPVASKPPTADLLPVSVAEPSPTLFRGATFPVGATIRNSGQGDAGPFKVRFLLLTDESANAPALVLGDASLPGLAAGTEQDVLQTVTLPYRTPDAFTADSPTARIVVSVDPDRSVDQSNTTNDTLAAPAVQLKVLSADGQTNVPILPGGTTTAGAKGTTATTPPTAPGTGSNFASTTVAASAVPVVAATTTTTTTSTPTPTKTAAPALAPKAAARQAALAARQHAAAAKRAAAAAKAHARAVAHRALVQARANAIRLYQPGGTGTKA